MKPNYKNDFAPQEGKIWLNAASEGPLPLSAGRALSEAIRWKSQPYLLDNNKFASVPAGLKDSIGRLLNVNSRDVILGNSASYGLHILANGISWNAGDEILLMQNDFPTSILPWLALEKKGVKVIQVKPKEKVLHPQELAKNISKKTKLFCISHVHTFSGYTLDIEKFAQICRDKNIIFVLNISQSAGTMPLDLTKFHIDAVVCAGYKWLCGPYGTGFAWINPELRDSLVLNSAYWIPMLSEEDLKGDEPLKLREFKSARKYDVFGTANFFNFVPFKVAIDFWLNAGLDKVQSTNQALIDILIKGLNKKKIDLISPREGEWRSNLVVVSHKDKTKNQKIYEMLWQKGIYTAMWKGNIRVSPHVYNTEEEIAELLAVISSNS